MRVRQGLGAVALVLVGAGPTVWAQGAAPARAVDRTSSDRTPPASCQVAQFKGLAFGVHDPGERAAKALAWLRERADACSPPQLEALRANAAAWLGSALTAEITVLLDGALESRPSGDARRVGQLYDHEGRTPPPAGTETVRTGTPRAPVVQPMVNNGLLSGTVPPAVAVPLPRPGQAPGGPPAMPGAPPGSSGAPDATPATSPPGAVRTR